MTARDESGMSRRRFAAAAAAGLGAACATGVAGCIQAAGGSQPARGAGLADTVFHAFTSHRLVGIGEVHQTHALQNHFDALTPLLTDPRLPDVVDDIVVEFGNALYQDTIDRFIAGQPVGDADLRPAWRNTTQSPLTTYDAPVYEQFLRTVRAVNWTLPPAKQIRVLLGDPPIDWRNITSVDEIQAFGGEQRTAYPASLIEKHVLAKGRRA